MAIVTATEVTLYSNISASAATITASGRIPIVQERINWICNNYFLTELQIRSTVTFNATGLTIATGIDLATYGFAAGDEVYVYHSYRNDGYHTVSSISGTVMTLVTGSTVVDELSGQSVMISVVKWPTDVKQTAALMVEYDYDKRSKRTAGVKSRSLGPWSESYSESNAEFGYPQELVEPLFSHRIARLM